MFPTSPPRLLDRMDGREVRGELREGTTEGEKDKERKPPTPQHLKHDCIIDEETKRNIYLSLRMCRS